MHILYAAPVLPEYLARLRGHLSAGDTFDALPRIGLDDLARVAQADVLIVLGAVTAETIAAARKLRLIQVLGAGYDGVDLDAARSAGVPVATTGGANAVSVAEHAFALMLALARRVTDSDARIKSGDWPQLARYAGGVFELQGKTLGLIGLGNVGRAIARMARGFDMRLVYFARHHAPDEAALGASYQPLLNPLLGNPAVVMTPHMAGAAQEAIDRTFGAVFDNIRRLAAGQPIT